MIENIQLKIVRFCLYKEDFYLSYEEIYALRKSFIRRRFLVDPNRKIRKHMRLNEFRNLYTDLGRLMQYVLGWDSSVSLIDMLVDLYDPDAYRFKVNNDCEIIGSSQARDVLLFTGLFCKMVLGPYKKGECLSVINREVKDRDYILFVWKKVFEAR